ncbi:hypothetical protein BH09PAT4_BH09PAT4_00220 [soil metagenome]
MNPLIENVIQALQRSWQRDTSYSPVEWSQENSARGQCTVSALVVQHYLGGDLRRYRVTGPNIDETHYCNLLPDGTLLDTTASQYRVPVTLTVKPFALIGYSSAREKRLADDDTRRRYEKLLERVAKYID